MNLLELSAWIEDTRLSYAMVTNQWAIPTVQSAHIIAIGFVFATSALVNLKLSGLVAQKQSLKLQHIGYYPWIAGGLIVLLLSGLMLIAGEPYRYLLNWLFWFKMGFIIVATLITLGVRGALEDRPFNELTKKKRGAFRAAAVGSMILWIVIIACGRWIAYAGQMVG